MAPVVTVTPSVALLWVEVLSPWQSLQLAPSVIKPVVTWLLWASLRAVPFLFLLGQAPAMVPVSLPALWHLVHLAGLAGNVVFQAGVTVL